jgi:hypothetical protein
VIYSLNTRAIVTILAENSSVPAQPKKVKHGAVIVFVDTVVTATNYWFELDRDTSKDEKCTA